MLLYSIFWFVNHCVLFQNRATSFKKLCSSAEQAKNEADAKLQILEDRVNNLDLEVEKILENSEKNSKAEYDRVIFESQKIAQQITHNAKKIAQMEVSKACNELKKDIWDQSRNLVVEKIKSEFNEAKHKGYVEKQASALSEYSK